MSRRWFAEDVAFIFECKAIGVSDKIIASEINSTEAAVSSIVTNARKNGFDSYPKRSKEN